MDHSNMPGMRSGTPDGQPMAGHDMSGMDMRSMMAHCAQMRADAARGTSTGMQSMMAQCNEMDRSMGQGSSHPSR
jgi:hypothetical protein